MAAVEAEVGHPNLPLLIEEALSPELFAPSLFAASMSRDLNTAARRIATYKKLVSPLRLRVDVSHDQTTISTEWPAAADPPPSLVLTETLFWVALARLGTRSRIEPVRVTTWSAPDDAAAYRDFLGVELEERPEPAVTFRAVDAARPFLTANDAVWETFEPQLRRRLADLDADAPVGERVAAVLLELLPAGRTTVAEVATELAVSARTLHRQLHSEGASFQHILNVTRERLARHYLGDPARSAAEIAFLLGYGDTSSFYRAFQSWTGQTPEQARATLATA